MHDICMSNNMHILGDSWQPNCLAGSVSGMAYNKFRTNYELRAPLANNFHLIETCSSYFGIQYIVVLQMVGLGWVGLSCCWVVV